MEKVSTGFYCDDCCKVVIDFRDKTNEQILESIRSSAEQPCGIFNSSQVNSSRTFPEQIVRFAAALLLVFGAVLFQSCGNDEEVAGKMCVSDSQLFVDSVREEIAMQKLRADSAWKADSLQNQYSDSLDKGNHGR